MSFGVPAFAGLVSCLSSTLGARFRAWAFDSLVYVMPGQDCSGNRMSAELAMGGGR